MSKRWLPLVGLLMFACADDGPMAPEPTGFTITLQNVFTEYDFLKSGSFSTPVGATAAGPLAAGDAYEISFSAGLGSKLSFATMLVQSNDLFYAPAPAGIDLFDASNNPVSGDITSQVMLWDAGSEVNEEPGAGANQPLMGGGATGTDEGGVVQLVSASGDGFTYPAVDAVLTVTLTSSGTDFTLRIENVSTTTTIPADDLSVLVTPGVWVVHSTEGPLFTEGMADRGEGLEMLAESGDGSALSAVLTAATGFTSPFAPGVWAVHDSDGPIFTAGSADYGDGLEGLAEDGDPSTLASTLASAAGLTSSGSFSIPAGESMAGPLLPGASYEFTIEAVPGDMLSFATMLVHSNDLFVAPGANGLMLFDGNSIALTGDITSQLTLWDAGTEVNEEPGVGANQPARGGAATGTMEMGTVMAVADGFTYPALSDMIMVTITPIP